MPSLDKYHFWFKSKGETTKARCKKMVQQVGFTEMRRKTEVFIHYEKHPSHMSSYCPLVVFPNALKLRTLAFLPHIFQKFIKLQGRKLWKPEKYTCTLIMLENLVLLLQRKPKIILCSSLYASGRCETDEIWTLPIITVFRLLLPVYLCICSASSWR